MKLCEFVSLARRAVVSWYHELGFEEPKHYRIGAEDEKVFKQYLMLCGFSELSLLKLEQAFKFGCKWGMAKIYDTDWQLHIRCFPDNLHDFVFVNAHWEYSRHDPKKHFEHDENWERGKELLAGIVEKFDVFKKR
jgi:hypothetical protein